MTAKTVPDSAAPKSSYADRLRNVRAGTRQELTVTRHLFRGEPSYVVTDPMTLQSHRFDPANYNIFIAIDQRRELQEIFEMLCEDNNLQQEDEEHFYQFVFRLHQLGFLSLPFSDDKLLYQRNVRLKQQRLKQQITGILFLQIPLFNPDSFLERTLPYARHIFSRWFFGAWICLIIFAGYVAFKGFPQLLQPIQGVLLPQNLPLMWLTLIVLKLFHEFGHAYATKLFGGYVPEMGAYLIMFTPCAYVDATACWGFTRRRDRIIVSMAGMYVESIFAACAVLVWSVTSPGMLHDLAYNIILLASVITILFNISPLMRFDGYYVLSDVLEIPNLRQRSTQYVTNIAKRIFLSIQSPPPSGSRWARLFLFCLGVASSIYRIAITLGIATLVAMKIPGVGIVAAALLLGKFIVGSLKRLTLYLWKAEETIRVRRRAIAMSIMVLVGLPTALSLLPIPTSVYASGVFERQNESVIHAGVDGFIQTIPARLGDQLEQGDIIAILEHDTLNERIIEVSAVIEASNIRYNALLIHDPILALREKEQLAVYQLELQNRQAEVDELTVRAENRGTIIKGLRETDLGRYLQVGEPIAAIVSGAWQVRAILTENEIATARPEVGDTVEIRTITSPDRVIQGIITRVAPTGSRTIHKEALTHTGGGDIAVLEKNSRAQQPYFEITVEAIEAESYKHIYGVVCNLRMRADSETIGTSLVRRFFRFLDMLNQR